MAKKTPLAKELIKIAKTLVASEAKIAASEDQDFNFTKYKVKIFGRIRTDEYDVDNDQKWLNPLTKAELTNAFEGRYEDLAQNTRQGLKEFINSIEAPVLTKLEEDTFEAYFVVHALKELTESEEKALISFIDGQCSDGWGEGFEQQEVGEGGYTVSLWTRGKSPVIKKI